MINYGTVTIVELLLVPIYAFAIFVISINWAWPRIADSNVNNGIVSKRMVSYAVLLKLAMSILYCLIFLLYYGDGDTLRYYAESSLLHRFVADNPGLILEVLGLDGRTYYNYFTAHGVQLPTMLEYYNTQQVTIIKCAMIFSVIGLNSAFVMAMLFGTVSTIGSVFIFRCFQRLLHGPARVLMFKLLFFLPTLLFWSNGISKDALTYGFMCIFCAIVIESLFDRTLPRVPKLLLMLISFWLCYNIKPYIALVTLLALGVYAALSMVAVIRSKALRLLVFTGLGFAAVAVLFVFQERITSSANSLVIEEALNSTEALRQHLLDDSGESGSGFDLGKVDPSIQGILRIAPRAICATVFRPFLWEARKPIVLASALENFWLLAFVCILTLRLGLLRFVILILGKPIYIASLAYIVIFGLLVGITTSNFGALVRYKIPLLPWFFLLVCIAQEAVHRKKLVKQV
jgi:hypothetical protein